MRIIVYTKNNNDIDRVQLPLHRGEFNHDIELKFEDAIREILPTLKQRGFEFTDININVTGYNYTTPMSEHIDFEEVS